MTTPTEALREMVRRFPKEFSGFAELYRKYDVPARDTEVAKAKCAELVAYVEARYAELSEARLEVFDQMNQYLEDQHVLGGCGLPQRNGCSISIAHEGLDYYFKWLDGEGSLRVSSHKDGVCTFHIETKEQYANTPVDLIKEAIDRKLAMTLEEGIEGVEWMIEETQQVRGWYKR